MALTIDTGRLIRYLLKRVWLIVLCAVIGFGVMYYHAVYMTTDTYTASATMYVYSGNPNVVNYQYADTSDLNTAVRLVDIYKVVIRSNKVLDAVAERFHHKMGNEYISSTLKVESMSETGVMKISCTTEDPQLSMEICNAVADIAPAEIIRVVNAGSVEVIDYAEVPIDPDSRRILSEGAIGALVGAGVVVAILFLLFITNRKLVDSKELTENYQFPLLSTIPKQHTQEQKQNYLLHDKTPSQVLAAYGKLRMNLFFAMHGKSNVVVISSSIPGESKSTLTANLGISFAMDGKRVLLIDADMRKPTQAKLFELDESTGGLSNLLAEDKERTDGIRENVRPNLDVLPAGTVPPNPSELLNSPEMRAFLDRVRPQYDVILIDTPPINVVTDALVLSDAEVGMLFVTRHGYSDHREIRQALSAAEFTGITIFGMVMTCATKSGDGYYGYYYYKHYYGAYDRYRKHNYGDYYRYGSHYH